MGGEDRTGLVDVVGSSIHRHPKEVVQKAEDPESLGKLRVTRNMLRSTP